MHFFGIGIGFAIGIEIWIGILNNDMELEIYTLMVVFPGLS
jgi:hypothetical protein